MSHHSPRQQPRLLTVTALVEVPASYDLDADASSFYELALSLVPGTKFGVVTEGATDAALALGAIFAYPHLMIDPALAIAATGALPPDSLPGEGL